MTIYIVIEGMERYGTSDELAAFLTRYQAEKYCRNVAKEPDSDWVEYENADGNPAWESADPIHDYTYDRDLIRIKEVTLHKDNNKK